MRKTLCEVFVDGKPVTQWKVNPEEAGLPKHYMIPKYRLGLSVYESPYTIHSVKVRQVRQ